MLRTALPLLNNFVPKVAVPFLKVTFPVGTTVDDDETVAVKGTLCPTVEGLPLDATVVTVLYLLTTSTVACEVLGAKVVSPA
jgi:hypothetical protein